MLKRGYLAGNIFYLTFAHKEEIIADYFSSVDEVFETLAKAIEQDNVKNKLEVYVSHTGFARLT